MKIKSLYKRAAHIGICYLRHMRNQHRKVSYGSKFTNKKLVFKEIG